MGTVAIDPVLCDADARMKRLLHTAEPSLSMRNVPVNRVVRSVNEVFRRACVEETDKHMECALVLYMRFASLAVDMLPCRPDYHELDNAEKVKLNQKLRAAIERAENIKVVLRKQFAKEAEIYNQERIRREEAARAQMLAEHAPPVAPRGEHVSASVHADAPPGSHRQPILLPSEAAERSRQPPAVAPAPAPRAPPSAPPQTNTSSAFVYTSQYERDSIEDRLQRIVLPSDLVPQFVLLAQANTDVNVETCGVLCGKLVSGQLVVTACVLPKQSGGSDSCVTEDEYAVFDFQDKQDLMTLGWIHTHPSQTAFLSSVDMHTHFAYQALLAEAIAVVFSPKFNETGVFRLSEDGLRQIEGCREKGFHPHQQTPPLFKVHLQCFVAHLIAMSRLANVPLVRAVALSIVPPAFVHALAEKGDSDSARKTSEKFASWFCDAYRLANAAKSGKVRRAGVKISDLLRALRSKLCWSTLQLALIFVAAVRALGVPARLAMSAQPASLKLHIAQPENSASTSKTEKKAKKSSSKKDADGSKNSGADKSDGSAADTDSAAHMHYWAEIYVKADETWIAVDVSHACNSSSVVGVERQLADVLSRKLPVHYVLVVDNEQGIRDVTVRYTGPLTNDVQRLRTDPAWWRETMDAFAPFEHPIRTRLEDMQLQELAKAAPMPVTVGEYKNHPLYALRRHLLKFEAIYPRDAPVLGHVRGEPIFSRRCVHTLHAKENWIKLARTIKEGEEPYKIVKARPKMGVPKAEQGDRPLPLFGQWQTEKYVPPPVVDGKVPRNSFGNIELYKLDGMLPPGCAYVTLPRAQDVARRLDIDAVPALVGWDVHGGRSHPVIEGVVVLKENESALIDACRENLAILKQKELDMKQTRALANWKLLVRFVVRKENMRRLFGDKHKGIHEEIVEKQYEIYQRHIKVAGTDN